MDRETRKNLFLSGVGSASGGTYFKVGVQGMGTVQGDIDCVDCSLEGMTTIRGSIKAETMKAQGAVRILGNITGGAIALEGRVKIFGGCDADQFVATGAMTIRGLLNAEDVSFRLYGPSHVKEIGAHRVRVEQEKGPSVFGRLKTLSVDTVEGDDIYLENTIAKVVRGNTVVIGEGSKVELVEYHDKLDRHEGASISIERKV